MWKKCRTPRWVIRRRFKFPDTGEIFPCSAFGHGTLPWALERGANELYAKRACGVYDNCGEGGIPVKDQVSWRGIKRKRLTQLLRHPSACWMRGDVKMKNLTPVLGDYEEAIEDIKGEHRQSEEVRCGNDLAVIGKESRPSPGRLGTRGALRIQFSTVRSEKPKPSILNSHESVVLPTSDSPRLSGRSTHATPCSSAFFRLGPYAGRSISSTA
jgi:hypothetical protein